MGFTVLFLLLLVTAGWWLYSRWSAVRDAQAARREAELMFVFEARSEMGAKPIATTPAPSDFYPTLPQHDAGSTATPLGGMPRARRQRAD